MSCSFLCMEQINYLQLDKESTVFCILLIKNTTALMLSDPITEKPHVKAHKCRYKHEVILNNYVIWIVNQLSK